MAICMPAEGLAPLPVLYHDDHLIAVHKPAGLLVHRSGLDAHELDTAVERLRRQWAGPQPAFLAPAHRLDKGTSGVLVFALNATAARQLGAAFESQQTRKRYLALVRGWPEPAQVVDHLLTRAMPPRGRPCCWPNLHRAGGTRSAATSSTSATPSWATPPMAKARTIGRWQLGWAWHACGCTPGN
jgi:tRNA pseudouridine65 synthase